MKTTIQDLSSKIKKAIATMITDIDCTIQDITDIYDDAFGTCICIGNQEYYVFTDREDAEQAVYKYWEDMAQDDPKEFACIIGDDRLIKWALNQSDEYGICNADEFFEVCGQHCEETLAGYDGQENEINGIYYYRRN